MTADYTELEAWLRTSCVRFGLFCLITDERRLALADAIADLCKSDAEQTRMLDRIASRLGLRHDAGLDEESVSDFLDAISTIECERDRYKAALEGERKRVAAHFPYDMRRRIINLPPPSLNEEAMLASSGDGNS